MTKLTLFFAAIGALLALLHATPSRAAPPTKVWVSKAGVDNASCGAITTPCATFQQAHDNVAAGGEVGVLTPGDYASPTSTGLTITKSISITNDSSGEAGIASPSNSQGIFVGAGNGDVVSLRGLVLDGRFLEQSGIVFQTGLALHIQNCVIRNFSQGGIFYFVGANNANSRLFVSDTIIFNNGSFAGTGGIIVRSITASHGSVVLDRIHLENNVDGLFIDGHFTTGAGTHTIVRDSVISGNAANGIHAFTLAGKAPAFAIVERSSIVNNRQNGILADGPGATLLLNDSTVARNAVGISTVNSGQLFSYRNNRINNNIGPDGAPTSFLTLN